MTDTKRLSIVVPIRDRVAHYVKFIPHVRQCFARDNTNQFIDYRVMFVEQTFGEPFNRGLLKNIGFQLTRHESDYVCFHDVDYLPVWADYRWTDQPLGIVWYGAEAKAIDPGKSSLMVRHNLEHFYGGAILVPNKLFEQVNGYSNEYWGWGYEDTDLKSRFALHGVEMGHRKGTFTALGHKNEGFEGDGSESPMAKVNKALFASHWGKQGDKSCGSGLSDLQYTLVDRKAIPDPSPERESVWEIVKIQPLCKPSNSHLKAMP